MTTKNNILCTASIRKNQVFLNGELYFGEEEQIPFTDFSKSLYSKLQLKYPKFFKMDNLSKLAFLATEVLLQTEGLSEFDQDTALLFTNRSSSLDTDLNYQKTIANPENFFPSPALFVYTLPNICLGEIAIKNNLQTDNGFFVFDAFNPEFIAQYANATMEKKKATNVLCAWVDFLEDHYEAFICLIGQTTNPVKPENNPYELEKKYKTPLWKH